MYCPICGRHLINDDQICSVCNSSSEPIISDTKNKSKIGVVVAVSIIIIAITFGSIFYFTETSFDVAENPIAESIEIFSPVNLSIPDSIILPSNTKSTEELRQYALELINKDRAEHDLEPVLLSHNQAAQAHAQDVFETGTISHWMSNGEKPYMTYTRFSGTGNVQQNVAQSWCKGLACNLDPSNEIQRAEFRMMYDDAHANWGHRDNILRDYHTHVSIGIVYDKHNFVFVQNFEDNYLTFFEPILPDDGTVNLVGNTTLGKIQNISIFYDEFPSESTYLQYRDETQYGFGDLISIVEKPLPFGFSYNEPEEIELIEATKWDVKKNEFNLEFNIWPLFTKSGVYTMTVWIEDGEQSIPATSYSIFVKE